MAFDFAAAADSSETMVALIAAQRAVLMEPLDHCLTAMDFDHESENPLVELDLPSSAEVPRRLVPVISEFLVEAARNWRAHGRQNRLERNREGKPERCRILVQIRVTAMGLRLEFHDDGPGISANTILDQVESSGSLQEWQLSSLRVEASRGNVAPVYSVLFRDGVTSKSEVDFTSGRGMGLSRLERLAAECGGQISASASKRLGGFLLSLELPCSLLGLGVVRQADRVFGLAKGHEISEAKLFYRLPVEASAWVAQSFGSSSVSWISLETRVTVGGIFQAQGLCLDSSDI